MALIEMEGRSPSRLDGIGESGGPRAFSVQPFRGHADGSAEIVFGIVQAAPHEKRGIAQLANRTFVIPRHGVQFPVRQARKKPHHPVFPLRGRGMLDFSGHRSCQVD